MPPHHDLIARRDHVIDGDPDIREGRTVHLDRTLENLGATKRTDVSRFGRVMVHSIRRHELIDQCEVALVERLLKQASRSVCWIDLNR
jgi:hypothetical protein